MRIRQDTPERLVLEDRPWLLGSILAGVTLGLTALALTLGADSLWRGLGLGLGAALFAAGFVVFVRCVIVIFDRPTGAVVIRSVGLLGQTEATHPLAAITGAAVQTAVSRSTSQPGKLATTSETHRVVLHLGGSPLPLSRVYSGGPGAASCAAAINLWLGQGQGGQIA